MKLATALATTAALIAPVAQAETFRVADVLPPEHHVSQSLTQWFMAEVTARTDGAIEFQHFPSSQLGKPQDVPALVKNGIADIGFVVPTFVPETLPMTDVAALPGNYGTACQGSAALWQLVDEGVLAQDELAPAGLKAIMVYVNAPYEIFTADAPVTSVADLEGLKIRTAGGALDMTARALGAVSVRMSTPEIYESLSRGTIDGLFFGFDSFQTYGFDELATHATLGGNFGTVFATYLMKQETWDALSEEHKTVFRAVADEAMTRTCASVDDNRAATIAQLEEAGITFSEFSGDDLATLSDTLAEVNVQWADALEARGMPGEKVLADFRAAADAAQ
ncbi:MAG: TRAP transporter substrate-binding protein DctP [Pseudomonadota bacterium]